MQEKEVQRLQDNKTDPLHKTAKERVGMFDPPQDLKYVKRDAAEVALGVNVHKHTFTCNKKSQGTCREAFRQPIISDKSCLTQVIDNGKDGVKGKRVIDKRSTTTQTKKSRWPFDVVDYRIILLELHRQNEFVDDPEHTTCETDNPHNICTKCSFNQYVVDHNRIMASCMRCNQATSVLIFPQYEINTQKISTTCVKS